MLKEYFKIRILGSRLHDSAHFTPYPVTPHNIAYSKQLLLPQANILSLPGDQVVDYGDSQDISGLAQSFGQHDIVRTVGRVTRGMVVERYNRAGVIHERRHKDFPRFDQGAVDDPAANNMDAVDLLLDIKRDDAELLHRFGLEVEDGLERGIADRGTGDPLAFKVVAAALGSDLFEGVDVDVGEWHFNKPPKILNLLTKEYHDNICLSRNSWQEKID
jgi:hypothetical protein